MGPASGHHCYSNAVVQNRQTTCTLHSTLIGKSLRLRPWDLLLELSRVNTSRGHVSIAHLAVAPAWPLVSQESLAKPALD